jgi:hypothetical protein
MHSGFREIPNNHFLLPRRGDCLRVMILFFLHILFFTSSLQCVTFCPFNDEKRPAGALTVLGGFGIAYHCLGTVSVFFCFFLKRNFLKRNVFFRKSSGL